MQIYDNIYQKRMAQMKQAWQVLCFRKSFGNYENELQITTEYDLIIKGFNLKNNVINALGFLSYEKQLLELYSIPVYDELTVYLQDKYLHTSQQNLASLYLCNLYFAGYPSFPPQDQLTKTLIHLIQKGSIATIQNCLSLIQNAAHDFPEWKIKVTTQTSLCEVLYRSLTRKVSKRKGFHRLHNLKVIKLMTVLIYDSPRHKVFQPILQGLTPYLKYSPPNKENISTQQNYITQHAYLCFYHYSKMFPEEATIFAAAENIYQQLQDILHWCRFMSLFSEISVKILEMMLKHINVIPNKFNQAMFISCFVRLVEQEDTIFQFLAYAILLKAIDQQKIQVLSLAQQKIFLKKLEVEDQAEEILYNLARIYILAEGKAKNQQYTEKVKSVLESIKCRHPHQKDLIQYIDYAVSQFGSQ